MEHGHEQVLELQPGEEQVLWLEQLSTLHCTHGRASGLGETDMHTTQPSTLLYWFEFQDYFRIRKTPG